MRFLNILALFLLFANSIKASDTVRVAYLNDYLPYSYKNADGHADGLVIDWWKLWGKKTNKQISFIPSDLDGCLNLVNHGDADVIAALIYDNRLTESLNFGEYISKISTVLYLRKDLKPKSILELKDTIVVLDNVHESSELNEILPLIKTNVFHSFGELKREVHKNNVAGFVYDVPKPPDHYTFSFSPKGYYQYLEVHEDRLRPAVKKDNKELLESIIIGANEISDDDLKGIAGQWSIYKKDNTVRNLIVGFVFILVLVFCVALWFVKKQRAKITKNPLQYNKTNWAEMIAEGENDFVEFKSSMRWDYRQEKLNKTLEAVIAKTISAFLNTKGGMLFIGIDDNGTSLGVGPDIQTLSKKNSDGFLLALTNVINQQLGKKYHQFIRVQLFNFNEKEVCAVCMQKSDSPVFIRKNGQEEFYIRASASSQPLTMSEAMDYIKSNF